jgi:hypothetical protein
MMKASDLMGLGHRFHYKFLLRHCIVHQLHDCRSHHFLGNLVHLHGQFSLYVHPLVQEGCLHPYHTPYSPEYVVQYYTVEWCKSDQYILNPSFWKLVSSTHFISYLREPSPLLKFLDPIFKPLERDTKVQL